MFALSTAVRCTPAFLAFGLCAAPAVAKTADCQPTAQLSGADDLVGPVAALLVERGIATAPQPGCGATRVALSTHEDEIYLTIQHDDRQIERRARTPAGVATIVESWVRSNLTSSILKPDASIAPEAPVAPPDGVKEPGKVAVEVSLIPTVGLANDRSVWTSVSASLCVRVATICAGIGFHRAADSDLSGPAERLKTERQTYEVILTTDTQFRANKLLLRPGAGIGVGWTLRKTDQDEVPATENVAKVVGGLRLQLRFLAMLAITKKLNLVWALVGDYAPASKGAEILPNNFTLAADPRWLLRVGIGLSYEF